MKIAIIGSGNVGGTLGKRWARNGHAVVFSSRHPQSDEMKTLLGEAGASATSAAVAEAAGQSDVILLATPWPAARDSIAGAGDLAGKVVIDATNPLRSDLTGLEIGTSTSAGEMVA